MQMVCHLAPSTNRSPGRGCDRLRSLGAESVSTGAIKRNDGASTVTTKARPAQNRYLIDKSALACWTKAGVRKPSSRCTSATCSQRAAHLRSLPRRSACYGNGHPVPRPFRTPTSELTHSFPPASPRPVAMVPGAAGAGTQEALSVLARRVALFVWVVLSADQNAWVPAEQLPAHTGKVRTGNRPTPLVAVPPERPIAYEPAGELALVLPQRVGWEPDTEPSLGGQADRRQMLTFITRHPLRGLEVLSLLPSITPASFAPVHNVHATSRLGPPLDRHKCGELAGGRAVKTTHQHAVGGHAAILVDLNKVATL